MEDNRWIPKFLIVAIVALVFILAGIAPARRTGAVIVDKEAYEAGKTAPYLFMLRDTSVGDGYSVQYKILGCPRWETGMRNEWLEAVGLPKMY